MRGTLIRDFFIIFLYFSQSDFSFVTIHFKPTCQVLQRYLQTKHTLKPIYIYFICIEVYEEGDFGVFHFYICKLCENRNRLENDEGRVCFQFMRNSPN